MFKIKTSLTGKPKWLLSVSAVVSSLPSFFHPTFYLSLHLQPFSLAALYYVTKSISYKTFLLQCRSPCCISMATGKRSERSRLKPDVFTADQEEVGIDMAGQVQKYYSVRNSVTSAKFAFNPVDSFFFNSYLQPLPRCILKVAMVSSPW